MSYPLMMDPGSSPPHGETEEQRQRREAAEAAEIRRSWLLVQRVCNRHGCTNALKHDQQAAAGVQAGRVIPHPLPGNPPCQHPDHRRDLETAEEISEMLGLTPLLYKR